MRLRSLFGIAANKRFLIPNTPVKPKYISLNEVSKLVTMHCNGTTESTRSDTTRWYTSSSASNKGLTYTVSVGTFSI